MRNLFPAPRRTSRHVPAAFPADCRGAFYAGAVTAALLLGSAIPLSAQTAVPAATPAASAPAAKPARESAQKPAATAATTPVVEQQQPAGYPDKESGDRARAAMEYGAAASFYRQYRAKAEQAGDAKAQKDAYACELDALILANLAQSAQKLLDEYRAKYPRADEHAVDLWQAEIYLVQRKADEADKLLKKLIPSLEKLDPGLLRALSCAAFVAELKGDHAAAAKHYGEIAANAGVKTEFGRRAVERQAMAEAAQGKFTEAYALLNSLPVAESKRDVEALKLLSFYLALSEKGPESLAEDWSQLRSVSSPRKDNLFFLAACRIGEEFLRRGETVRAAEAFHLAYGLASVREDASAAMLRLMDAFDKLDSNEEAAELALRMISVFKDVQLSSDFKLRIAAILFRAGRPDDAVDVCLSCIPDVSAPAADREKAYRAALRTAMQEKAFPSALKLIDAFDTVPEGKPARAMDRAEVAWREGDPAKAAELYREVAKTSGDLWLEATLNAMRCYLDVGRYRDMLDVAAALRESDPGKTDPEIVLLTATAQDKTGDLAAAAQSYRDYEASAPEKPGNLASRERALFRAGQILCNLGQSAAAVGVFRRYCQKYRDDGSGRYWLIHALYSSGDEVQAERETWRFIEDNPDSQYAGAAMLRLAEHYRGTGSVQHAESTLDQLLSQNKNPKILASATYERALIAFQRDDLAAALDYLGQIDVSDPKNAPVADIHYLRGDIARASSDFAAARTEYEAAAKAAAGTSLEQAALGSVADCIYALAEAAPAETVPASSESAADKEGGAKPQTAQAAPATPADNYRKAYEAYQALLQMKGLLGEYKAMAIYKSAQSLWKAGDDRAAFDLFNQMVYLIPSKDAASRPVEAYWVFRAVEALESLAHEDPTVDNVESAVSALVWLGQTGTVDQASVRQRIRALRKKQYQPPLPAASSSTTSSSEASQS